MRQFGELEAVVMDNLPRKGFPGFVIREKDGRAYRYRPVHTREEHAAALMEQSLAGGGDRGTALLHLVERMPADEVARLREALNPSSRQKVT